MAVKQNYSLLPKKDSKNLVLYILVHTNEQYCRGCYCRSRLPVELPTLISLYYGFLGLTCGVKRIGHPTLSLHYPHKKLKQKQRGICLALVRILVYLAQQPDKYRCISTNCDRQHFCADIPCRIFVKLC